MEWLGWVFGSLPWIYLGYAAFRLFRTRNKRPAIDPAVRGEIEQTMEWWDAEYRALEAKVEPEAQVYRESNRVYAPFSWVGVGRFGRPTYRSVFGLTYAHSHTNRVAVTGCPACEAHGRDLERHRKYNKAYRPDVSAVMTKV